MTSSKEAEAPAKEPGEENTAVQPKTDGGEVVKEVMSNEEFFMRLDQKDDVYINDGGTWIKRTCAHKHSKQLKFMAQPSGWFEIDTTKMQFEKPEGFIETAVATIPGRDYSTSANSTSRQPGSRGGYATVGTRYYRHVTSPKPSHGFAGLQNQGATCYLNSLLQTLYMTVELRKAVFNWKYDETKDVENKTMVMTLQLQELFARIQHSEQGSQPTKSLTKSFGWNGAEVYQQHDVVELCQVMLDHLREHSHDEELQEVVKQFNCNILDYLACNVCGNSRNKFQILVCINLAINCPDVNTLDQALRKYANFEVLEDDNAVNCTKCDCKQPSKKGLAFKSFGKFLPIQLQRWTLNYNTFQREKIHKAIEFDTHLDVTPYLVDPEEAKDGTQYELYSMMIHRGGAYGGHYFAYVKDFATNKWYEFNDSRVSEIPEEEFKTMMDPSAAKENITSYGSGRTSPLTGAYMLVYRRIEEGNIDRVLDEAISTELLEQIDASDSKWKKEVAEINITVWFVNDSKKGEVLFSREETLESQVQKIIDHFRIGGDIKREDMRFRKVNTRLSVTEPYDDVDKKFDELNLDEDSHIGFEVKSPEEEFQKYEPKTKSYKVHCLEKESGEIKVPVNVEVSETGTTDDLRAKCAELLGVGTEQCKMLFEYRYNQKPELLEVTQQMNISDKTVFMVNDIYVEPCQNYQDDDEESIIARMHEEESHKQIYYYNPLDDRTDFSNTINLDDRITIKELRVKLGELLGVGPMDFKIKNMSQNEEKDLSKELNRSRINHNRLYLEPGTPMEIGQYVTTLYLDTRIDGEERFKVMGNFKINEDWMLDDLKDEVLENFSGEHDLGPKDSMRFRYQGQKKLLKDFVPFDKPLKSVSLLCEDGADLVLQPMSEPEELRHKKDIIVNICRYYPETQTLGKPREIVLDWKTRVKEGVRKELEDQTKGEINPDNLLYFKPISYFLLRKEFLYTSDWHLTKSQPGDAIHTPPWRTKSGDYILYKDDSEKEPKRDEYEGSGSGGTVSSALHMHRHRQERGIKILTAEEQVERQKNSGGANVDEDGDVVMGSRKSNSMY